MDDLLGGDIFGGGNAALGGSTAPQPVGAQYSLDGLLGGIGGPTPQQPGAGLVGFGMPSPPMDVQFAQTSDCDGEKF